MQQETLPLMATVDVADAASEWLEAHYGWHSPHGIGRGIAEVTGLWAERGALDSALRELGEARVLNRGWLVRHGATTDRSRPVWTFNRAAA